MKTLKTDVVILGAGNAALCAALSARENNAQVIVLERAPFEERGGNSAFTAGAFRFAYDTVEELYEVVDDLSDKEKATTDFGTYSIGDFFDDMGRVTEYRTDPDLAELLIRNSRDTLLWMKRAGIRFQPSYGRQAFKLNDKFRFWGGLSIEAWGGGPGLVEGLHGAAQKAGVQVLYGTRAIDLIREDNLVVGVSGVSGGQPIEVRAKSVILASGGFEANGEWRARYLGPGWDLAKVRGTRFNTGDAIRMALDAGAMSHGHWSGCHSVSWDRNAPEFGDLAVGDGFQKHSYPFGLMINAPGFRFVDEGADFRNYTYAKYGGVVLSQPGQFAWQIFDAKVTHLLRDEYRIRQVTKFKADTLEELATRMEDIDKDRFLDTITRFNQAVRTDVPFDPTVKDGRSAQGLDIPKSNWANRIDEPPFEAYAVTCGVTFTFGGLKITSDGQVLDTEDAPMPGLFAAGELVGGLFFVNYPGGTGLTSGSVFGRIAGRSAAIAVAG